MTQKTLKKTIDLTQLLQEEQILEKIKDVPVVGTGYRGTPVSVEKQEIHKFIKPNGRQIYEGPSRHIESLLKDKKQDYTKEHTGSIYTIHSSKPNSSMVNSVTQMPTRFMYEVHANGFESLYLDAVCQGEALLFGAKETSAFKLKQVDNLALAKIIEAINPHSRII
ncbi:MAG: hypothetical protein ACOCQQ_03600 [Candidatus Nanoarchaeia archaeon]